MIHIPDSSRGEPRRLDLMLQARPSLSPQGFIALMLFIAGVSFGAGIFFALIGAWPVLGFFGLDVLAIYIAFRLTYRRARMRERITLKGDEMKVERRHPDGRKESWKFQAYWMTIRLVRDRQGMPHVRLTSHGRYLDVGDFLPPEDRAPLAEKLNLAIAGLK